MSEVTVPRSPWPDDFPDVVVHVSLDARDRHRDFTAAKSGARAAALRLAEDLLSPDAITRVAAAAGPDALLLPVSALEVGGFNAIPDAMATIIGVKSGLAVRHGAVVQSNRVAHTRASGWHRLVTPALFAGDVERGRAYLLVDDHIGLGGTLANFRGYVEASGGKVVAITTLTESRDARAIAVRAETLSMLVSAHGQALENLWLDTFGHGLDCLTNVEAGYLARQRSSDVIRDRMVEAAEQARRRGVQAVEIEPSR